jgi:outer membrane immunogenic protein
LLYATGGLAYGGVKSSTTIAQSDTGILPGNVTATYAGTGSISETRAGWTAGGGVEWMFARQWSAKAEYLYYDLGSATYPVGSLVANVRCFFSPTWVADALSTTCFSGSIIRLGVSYQF